MTHIATEAQEVAEAFKHHAQLRTLRMHTDGVKIVADAWHSAEPIELARRDQDGMVWMRFSDNSHRHITVVRMILNGVLKGLGSRSHNIWRVDYQGRITLGTRAHQDAKWKNFTVTPDQWVPVAEGELGVLLARKLLISGASPR